MKELTKTEAFTDWAHAVAIDMAIEALKQRKENKNG